MARIEAERHSAMNQTLVAICAIADLESQMELVTPWTEDHPEFKATLTYIQQRDYHCSLDKLQQLVVQWLFELSKANMIVHVIFYSKVQVIGHIARRIGLSHDIWKEMQSLFLPSPTWIIAVGMT